MSAAEEAMKMQSTLTTKLEECRAMMTKMAADFQRKVGNLIFSVLWEGRRGEGLKTKKVEKSIKLGRK